MPTKRTRSEVEVLEQYRVALKNVEDQAQIAASMADFGYDAAMVAEGKSLLTETRQAFDFNKTENDQTFQAYSNFSILIASLETSYKMHRKKAKIIFRNDAITMDKLALTGSLPKAYINRLEIVKKFYAVAIKDTEIQSKLIRLKISFDDLIAANTLVSNSDAARSEYIREKGESQDATKAKDAAFAKMDDWMSEFYAVAKISLEDNPQLLEALGKQVRS